MATAPRQRRTRKIEYPTSDGKPMAETELHRDDMIDTIQTLQDHFAAEDRICISGNMLLYYEEGNRRKHVSPDVFAVRGVEKKRRDYYLLWEEGRPPELVIEITSKSTRLEDQKQKREIYRTILRVFEYFLFDPTEDYLKPPLQGFRLEAGDYVPIEAVDGRLPSRVLGLHLERAGQELRLFDPATRAWLPTRSERVEAERQRAEAEHQRAEAAEAVRTQIVEENARLRQEIEALRRQLGPE